MILSRQISTRRNRLKFAPSSFRLVLTLAVCLCSFCSRAQSRQATEPSDGSNLVRLQFVVLDSHDRPARVDLAQVTIVDKGQTAKSVANLQVGSEIPLRLGVLLDVSRSASQSPVFEEAVSKSISFVSTMLINPADKAFILKFTNSPQATGFMNKDQFSKFNLEFKPGGGTALYDSIVLACTERMMMAGPAEMLHLALVVISDGDDNDSHFSLDKTIAAAQQAGVVVFTISLNQNRLGDRGGHVLKALADNTGGEAFVPERSEIPGVFRKIEQHIENTYVALYTPADTQQDNHFRPVEVKISQKKLLVRAPKGYFSRPPMP
jgi:Ca-activated chloride channel homolog